MRRLHVLLLIALGIVVFVVVGGLLARAFSVDGAERSAIVALVQAEARGDVPAMLARIDGCSESLACRSRVAADAAALRRPGALSILELNPSAGISLGGSLGTARVAWKTPSSLPIVQCVRVRRAGSVLSGLRVHLLVISVRIRSDADCPAKY